MGLETGDFIDDLVETNPLGSDNVSQGDDHLRLIKHILKTQFPNLDAAVTATPDELNQLYKATMPPGLVSPFAGEVIPTGWYWCNGQEVSRTLEPDLYAVCLDTYGAGDGTTTFNVPDLRDRIVGGTTQDKGSVPPNERAAVHGKDNWVDTDLPTHTHVIDGVGDHTHEEAKTLNAAGAVSAAGTEFGVTDIALLAATAPAGAHTHTAQTTGDLTPADNRQETMYMNYMIKS